MGRRRQNYNDGIKKPQLIELLTDIVAASNAANSGAMQDAVDRAHDELVNVGLWNDEPLPVVDSNENADLYGYATSPFYAKLIASECYNGVVSHIEHVGPITLRDGTKCKEAYMVVGKTTIEAHAHA